MKKILMLNAFLWAAMLSVFGQNTWNNISLTGKNAKIFSSARQPRFNIVFTGGFPLRDVSPKIVAITDLQNAVFAPGTVEQLFEKLGGEFFIGEISGQKQTFEMSGQTQVMPGLRLGVRVGNRFEFRASGQHFQTKWTGAFPVTVLPFDQQSKFKTLKGGLSSVTSGVLAEADLAIFFANGAVRPFVRGGVRGQFAMQNEGGADIAGILLPLGIKPVETEFSAFGGAGLRWNFLKNGFVEAGAAFGKLPGGGHTPTVEIGIGWGFGGQGAAKAKKIADNAPCISDDKQCACGKVKFNAKIKHSPATGDVTEQTLGFDSHIDPESPDFQLYGGKKSVQRWEHSTAKTGDEISVELTELAPVCGNCDDQVCKPNPVQVFFWGKGFEGLSDDKENPYEIAREEMPGNREGEDKKFKYAAKYKLKEIKESPVLHVIVKFQCRPENEKCKPKACKEAFSVIFQI